jgi:hypothetical protein
MKNVFTVFLKLFIAIVLLSGSSSLFSQTDDSKDMKKLIDDVKADKQKLILAYMDLTAEQTKLFLPVYNDYQAELQNINERIGNLVLDYAGYYNNQTVTDEVSRKMLSELIAIDNKETEIKGKYSNKLLDILPAMKVVRYIQMENKIRAAIKYELASEIPLIR